MSGSWFRSMKMTAVPNVSGDRRLCSGFYCAAPRMLISLICLVMGMMVGCQNATRPPETAAVSGQRLRVVATVGMVADVVREVGGDRIEVTQLMGPGVDPHLYKATRDDVLRIMSADIVFSSGLMLEGRMEDTLNRLSETQSVYAITSRLPHEQLLSPDGAGGHPDPHVWMDVAAWASCLDVVVEGLSTSAPSGAEEFRSRADSLRQTLRILHEYGLASIASIPGERRVLVTSHDAFRYFGRAYGLEVVGVQGLSTESEAGLQQINELVDLLVDRKVAAVFVESSVPQKNILALIDGAKFRGHDVRIGGELFSDAMGAEGTWEGTYVGMLDHNITTVTNALGGTAPERGFSGRLSVREESP